LYEGVRDFRMRATHFPPPLKTCFASSTIKSPHLFLLFTKSVSIVTCSWRRFLKRMVRQRHECEGEPRKVFLTTLVFSSSSLFFPLLLQIPQQFLLIKTKMNSKKALCSGVLSKITHVRVQWFREKNGGTKNQKVLNEPIHVLSPPPPSSSTLWSTLQNPHPLDSVTSQEFHNQYHVLRFIFPKSCSKNRLNRGMRRKTWQQRGHIPPLSCFSSFFYILTCIPTWLDRN
jgi:hypothetical protein